MYGGYPDSDNWNKAASVLYFIFFKDKNNKKPICLRGKGGPAGFLLFDSLYPAVRI